MSNLIGITVIKGVASAAIQVCDMDLTAIVTAKRSQAVKLAATQKGTAQPTVEIVNDAGDLVYGLITDINPACGTVTVTKQSLCMAIEGAKDLSAAAQGTTLTVDPTTGLLTDDQTGAKLNATIIATPAKVCGIDGVDIANGAHVQLNF